MMKTIHTCIFNTSIFGRKTLKICLFNTSISDSSESVVHLIFHCSIALKVGRKVAAWFDLAIAQFSSAANMFHWVDNMQ